MKNFSLLFVLASFLSMTTIAHADDGPRIEPGPVQKLEDNGISLLNALSANSDQYQDLMRHGNTVTDATVQQQSPSVTVYTVTTQECTHGGVVGHRCFAGARLTILNTHERHGSRPVETYQTKLVVFR